MNYTPCCATWVFPRSKGVFVPRSRERLFCCFWVLLRLAVGQQVA